MLVHLRKKPIAIALANSAFESGDVLFTLLALGVTAAGGALLDATGLLTAADLAVCVMGFKLVDRPCWNNSSTFASKPCGLVSAG